MDTFKPEKGKARTHNPPVNSCRNTKSAIYGELRLAVEPLDLKQFGRNRKGD